MRSLSRRATQVCWFLLCFDVSCVADMLARDTLCPAAVSVANNAVASRATHVIFDQGNGYRVTGFKWDPLLHRTWATAINCVHPERPKMAILLPEPVQDISSRPLLRSERPPIAIIHAGDHVKVLDREDNLQIQVSGVAEDNGALSGKVHVRVLPIGLENDHQPQLLGVALSSNEVEISR